MPEAVRARFCIDCHHDELPAVLGSDLADEVRAGDGGAVQGDLVGSGVQQARRVVQATDAAAYGERDIDGLRDPGNQFREGLPAFQRCADVQVNEFIGPFQGIAAAEFHGVAHVLQAEEVDAFHHAAVLDVQTRDYPFCKHVAKSLSVIRFS